LIEQREDVSASRIVYNLRVPNSFTPRIPPSHPWTPFVSPHNLMAMRALSLITIFAVARSAVFGQAPRPAFDVASVKPCQHLVGPDYNNQLTYSPNGFTARNVTLKRLIAEACNLQLDQIFGPGWINQNEYDIDARTAEVATREQMALMLRTLLSERFNLKEHSEMREMRVYELVTGNSGPKIRPVSDGETVSSQGGFHFHGDLLRFADLLAVQFSIPAPGNPNEPARAGGDPIPVLDRTGLPGIYDFSVNIPPELGTDGFASWQRALQDQLGLKIESRKENVAVLVVDEAARIPTSN
jgi:uncharacterized protein (TIGR03435 family)